MRRQGGWAHERPAPAPDRPCRRFSTASASPTLVLTVLVAGVAGLARGFSGFGAALIFMPAASALVTPAVAAPVLLLADGILSLGFLPRAWMLARRKDVALMAAGAVIGVPLGTLVLNHADPLPLRWVIAGARLLHAAAAGLGLALPRHAAAGGDGAGRRLAGLFGGLAQMTRAARRRLLAVGQGDAWHHARQHHPVLRRDHALHLRELSRRRASSRRRACGSQRSWRPPMRWASSRARAPSPGQPGSLPPPVLRADRRSRWSPACRVWR